MKEIYYNNLTSNGRINVLHLILESNVGYLVKDNLIKQFILNWIDVKSIEKILKEC